jgi:hypothetical protein
MTDQISHERVLAGVVAIVTFVCLVYTVNAHGNEVQFVLENTLVQSIPLTVAEQVRPQSTSPEGFFEGGGLDFVDMYQCMCGPSTNDEEFRRWVGWWLVAAMFGGVPIAYLRRSRSTS